MRKLFRWLFFITAFSIFFFYSHSQKHQPDTTEIQQLYAEANIFYNKATALSAAPEKETEEISLNKKALELFQSVHDKIPKDIPFYDSIRFFSAFKLGELQHYFEQYKDALDGYNESIKIALKSSLPDSFLFKPYLYAGIIYYNQNHYDTALAYFKNAENTQLKYKNSLQESERLYNITGVVFYEKGDYKQAKNYFLKAIELLPRNHPYYKELFTNYNINLAQIYFKLEDYDEANTIYNRLLPFKVDENEINHNIGTINLYLGAASKALSYFRRVHYSSNKIIRLYNNMAVAFMNLQQFDSARYYLKKGMDANARFGVNTDHVAYGLILKSFGDMESTQGRPETALPYYQQAMLQFYPSFKASGIRSNPENFSGVFSYINLFNTLIAKAGALHQLYQRNLSLSQAEAELNSYQSAFKLTDYVSRTYNSDEARLFLDKSKYLVHVKPIDIAFELYKKTKEKKYLEDLYVFDQQTKASVLSLRFQQEENAKGKDSAVFSKEQNIKSNITRLSLRAAQINDSAAVSEINRKIRDLEIELGKVQENSAHASESIVIPSPEFLQDSFLDNKTAIISFHLSEEKLTTLSISSKNFDCVQQDLFENFHELVANYITRIKDDSDADGDTADAKKIYRFLFHQLNLENIERLIIIPDDELNYLSCESLINEHGDYLLQNYSITYQYATALLKKENADFSNHTTLAFAPFTNKGFKDSSLSLENLPNSGAEIAPLRGKKFEGNAATKTNFLQNISRYNVLHLATHAFVNPKDEKLSFIAFSPAATKDRQQFLLYADEIYNLPLSHTDLVILSACETGAGTLVRGEGVMSLSRAFAYAGCNNIITSLWNANDFSTAYLTNRLHFYLDKNYTIDQALRQSKLDYLQDKKINPRLKHPFYWSHLIFIGNYHPHTSHQHYWYYFAGALLLLIAFLLFKKTSPAFWRGWVNHRQTNAE